MRRLLLVALLVLAACSSKAPEVKETLCTPEQKQADFCTADYAPVCGWFDSEKVQCIKYPCAADYSNSCQACRDENVKSWSAGKCPA
ncbi:hypothetical protein HY493_01355 [Candidatus Woesearchaeota archaeon]|nr:hypothetical protein [Candidatus Woesearchaeota archaeon]